VQAEELGELSCHGARTCAAPPTSARARVHTSKCHRAKHARTRMLPAEALASAGTVTRRREQVACVSAYAAIITS